MDRVDRVDQMDFKTKAKLSIGSVVAVENFFPHQTTGTIPFFSFLYFSVCFCHKPSKRRNFLFSRLFFQ